MDHHSESLPVPARLTLTSPPDVLAAVPYIVGYHPRDALLVLGLRGEPPRLHTTFSRDIGPGPDTCATAGAGTAASAGDAAASMAAALRDEGCTIALAVGYGPADKVTRHVDALRAGAERAGILVREALRAADGRYWSYMCASPECCPPDGVPYDPAASAVAATAVANGLTAWPSREHIRAYLAPVEGAHRDRMRAATRAAERRGARLRRAAVSGGRDSYGPRFRTEGVRAVRAAVAAADRGEVSEDPGDLAWLSVLLESVRVRDEAWVLIDSANAAGQQRLWRQLLRFAEPPYRAAPGALLAVAAWAQGDTALADAALGRVREVAPDYSMAGLLRRALSAGLAWQGFPRERLESFWPPADP